MTKKHYEAIAAIILGESMRTPYGYRAAIAKRLADYFASDNKNFNRARFLAACGIEKESQT